MTYAQLLIQVKTEGRIQKDDSFDSIVIGLLNELFREAVESQRPFELRQDVDLNVVASTNGAITLPDDFFIWNQINFIDSDTGRTWPLVLQDNAVQPAPRGMYGHPKSFEILGNVLLIDPVTAIVLGDKVNLVYYKNPPVITAESINTENPIKRLEPFLIRAAIRRIRMFHSDDIQVASMLQGDIASAAKGYTNDEDEPQRTERPNSSGS